MIAAWILLGGGSALTQSFQIESWLISVPKATVVTFSNEFAVSANWGKRSVDRIGILVTKENEKRTRSLAQVMDEYGRKLQRFTCLSKKRYASDSTAECGRLTFRTNARSGGRYLSLFLYRSNSILELYVSHSTPNLSVTQTAIVQSIRRSRLREM